MLLGAQVGGAPRQQLDMLDFNRQVPKNYYGNESTQLNQKSFHAPLLVRVSLSVGCQFNLQVFLGKTGVVDNVLVSDGQQVVVEIDWLHFWVPLTFLRRLQLLRLY